MADFMLNTDAFAFGMEADARLRSTVVSVIMLDRTPDWDVLVDRFERAARMLPMFQQRVVRTVPPAPPQWVRDPDFDLRYHLRRVNAPAPATLETVLEMARRAEMDEFDHARPLWNVTLVEGLENGTAALLCKLHHALADGIGAIQIAMLIFDFQREPRDLGPLPPELTGNQLGALDKVRESLAYDAGLVTKLTRDVAVAAPRLFLESVRRPRTTLNNAVGTATSVYRTVRPLYQTASPIMKDRRMVRELGVHEVPLKTLKAAAHRAGGTVNDGFLAGVTGGLRLYHLHHGVEVGDLRITMPVSIRAKDEVVGNRITLLRFELPVGEVDPLERIRRIHLRTVAARGERSLPHTQAIAGGLNLLPRWYIAAILRHVDFLASDVTGLPKQAFIGGAAVTMQYAFGPTIGAAVNVTLMTYVDTCALGINADTGAIPDFTVFRECLVAGFDEVLALAEQPADVPPKLSERRPHESDGNGHRQRRRTVTKL